MTIVKTIGEIVFSERKKTVVNIVNIENKIRLDIRTYFYSSDNEWIPTKKGINLPIERTNDLVSLLNQIELVRK